MRVSPRNGTCEIVYENTYNVDRYISMDISLAWISLFVWVIASGMLGLTSPFRLFGASCCVKDGGSKYMKIHRLGLIFSFVSILASELCYLVFLNSMKVLLKCFEFYLIYELVKYLYHCTRWIKLYRIVIVLSFLSFIEWQTYICKILPQTEIVHYKMSCSSGPARLFNIFSLK